MKSIVRNIGYNVAYQMLAIILPLITTPYISRVLGAEKIGIYAYTNAIAYNFLLFAMLGMSNLGNRSIAAENEDVEKRSGIFWNLYSIQFSMFLIAITIYIAYTVYFASDYRTYLFLQLIYLVSGLFDISWFYFGMEKFKITVLRNTIIKLVSVICIFVFVKDASDLGIYTIIMSGSYLLSQLYLWIPLKKYIVLEKPVWNTIKSYLQPLIILFIPVIAYSVYKVMDKIMLGFMSDMSQVGYYENSLKIINIPIGMINALGVVMLPRMSSIVAKHDSDRMKNYIRISMKFVSLITSVICFGIIGIGNNLAITYFGPEYISCGRLMKLLSVTCFFVAWANVGRTQYIIPNKLDKIYVTSTLGGAGINLIINLMFIPRYAATGAAIGTVAAEFSVMAIQFFLLRREINMYNFIVDSKYYIFVGLIMSIAVSTVEYWLPFGWQSLFIEIAVGGIVFLTLIFLYMKKSQDEILSLICNLFKRGDNL